MPIPAIACLANAGRLDIGDFRWPYLQAHMHHQEGELGLAAAVMAEALRRIPDDPGAIGADELAARCFLSEMAQRLDQPADLSRKCKAVWNIFNQNDLRSIVIGWWPSHPAEPINGVMISDHFHRAKGRDETEWPVMKGSVHPESLAEALAEVRLHPAELVGDLLDFLIPLAREIDQSKDRRLKAWRSLFANVSRFTRPQLGSSTMRPGIFSPFTTMPSTISVTDS